MAKLMVMIWPNNTAYWACTSRIMPISSDSPIHVPHDEPRFRQRGVHILAQLDDLAVLHPQDEAIAVVVILSAHRLHFAARKHDDAVVLGDDRVGEVAVIGREIGEERRGALVLDRVLAILAARDAGLD